MRILHVSPSSPTPQPPAPAALEFLPHKIIRSTHDISQLMHHTSVDVVLFDASTDLRSAAKIAGRLTSAGISAPLLMVLSEGGLAAVSPDWMASDFVLTTAGPGEIEARLRLAGSTAPVAEDENTPLRAGPLKIDEGSYTATLSGTVLDLTYKEFELLRFMVQHPDRVFTREQLLNDVWGYDYYGGTRTVDVHIRRLRAKLSPDFDSSIHTVRNVGYRFSPVHEESPA